MKRKITEKVYDERLYDEPFLKWVTEIVNKTPYQYLDALVIDIDSDDYSPHVVVTYERDETPEEEMARTENEKVRAWHQQEMERNTLRALKEKYPND